MNNKQRAKALQTALTSMYQRIDETLTLDEIAQAASVSLASLKRIFQDSLGVSPGQVMRRIRMEHALKSLQGNAKSVLEVALSSGYQDHSAFTRAFKDYFLFAPKDASEANHVSECEHIELDEPSIVQLKSITAYGFTKTGLYEQCAPDAWGELAKVLQEDDHLGHFIGAPHGDPHDQATARDAVSFTAAATHTIPSADMVELVVPAGRYACFEFFGTPPKKGLAYHWIYGQWFPRNPNYVVGDNSYVFTDSFPSAFEKASMKIYIPLIEKGE